MLGSAACGGDGNSATARPVSPPTMATTEPDDREDDRPDVRAATKEAGEDAETAPDSAAGIYEATTGGLDPSVEDVPPRVYVPNSEAGTVSVIDPETYEVVVEHQVGVKPHHVTPSWDMQTLYALDTAGDSLIPFDPRTSQPGEPIPVEDPYNLYFSPDGELALVVAERFSRIDLRDPETWELIAEIPVPQPGVNHGDFSADGRYFYVSTEWSGFVVKIDLQEHKVVEERQVGVEMIDTKLSPDGEVLFVADQDRNGVFVLDAEDLTELEFIPTGDGAHGLYYSRDTTRLFVSNRMAGSVSVIDVASRAVEDTWTIPDGGSPDMGGVSVDGSELWLTGRYHGEAYVFDTETGELKERIPTGEGSHGLAVWPQPGNYSTGHTGVMR
jgi:YVTN family beta-propeller protein